MRLLVALACVACGTPVHHGADASPPDVAPNTLTTNDGPPPAGAVTMTITRNGIAVPMVAVVFQGTDSSLVSAVLTNEQGLAWAVMPDGGFATAIRQDGSGLYELTTFSQVQSSDQLAIDLARGPRNETLLSVSLNADPGATSHLLYTSCGGPFAVDPTVTTDIQLVGCGSVADMLVLALDSDGQPLHSFYQGDVALTGQAVVLSGMYTSLADETFTYTSVPSGVSWLGTYHALANANGRTFDATAGAAPAAGSAQTTLRMPPTNSATLTATTMFADEIGEQLIYEERSAGVTPYTLDITSARLPAYATPPSYEPATRTVTWSESAGAVQPNVVRARVHVYRDDIPASHAWGWQIVAPRAGTAIAYPQLPVFGFDFNPIATDVTGVDELTTANVPGGYAAVRARGFGDYTATIMGTPGRMVVQTLRPPML